MPHVRVDRREGVQVLEVVAGAGSSTRDLLTALGGTGRWLLDGRPLAEGDRLDIPDGAALVCGGPSGPAQAPTLATVCVTAGPDAGAEIPLPAGTSRVGRDPGQAIVLDDAAVSAVHAEIRVVADGPPVIRDLGSSNRVRVTALGRGRVALRVGSSWLLLRPGTPPTSGGGVLVRSPRPPLPPGPAPVVPPATPAVTPTSTPFGWATLVAPLVLGVVMAVVVDPRLAMFVLLSPLMLVGSWLEDRRRSARGDENARSAGADELARFRSDLRAAAAVSRVRLEAHAPDIAAVRRSAVTGDGLWGRRRRDEDAWQLRVGTGTSQIDLPLAADGKVMPAVAGEVAIAGRLPDAPVTVSLSAHTAVAVVGDRPLARAAARALLLRCCIQQGPADLRALVVTDDPDAWRWTAWLPHVASPTVPGRRWLVTDRLGAVSDEVVAAPVPILIVLDRNDVAATTLTAALVAREDAEIRALILAAGSSLPAVVTHVVNVGSPDGGRLDDLTTGAGAPVVADGVRIALAEETARHLARWRDPELQDAGCGVPERVALLDLLGFGDDVDADAVAVRWRDGDRRVRTVLGTAADGPVVVDLIADGPHALVGGTTGSGKSELLRSLVAGLAATVDPEHLGFVLIDYKGGAAFDACSQLPHTLGYVTDLDGRLAGRALTGLEAELHERERRLRAAGVDCLDAYWQARPDDVLPRIVVVVDEFATLAAELPDFLDALVDVAQRGRSLGVHIVLATQRPAGVVTDDIRANTTMRLCLRVQDRTDSRDVLDATDAADLPRSLPGRAYLRLGPGELVAFQAAHVTGRRPVPPRIELRPMSFRCEDVGPRAPDGDGPTDLERLVEACRSAAAGMRPAARPWPEPLDPQLRLADLDGSGSGDGRLVVGRLDAPEEQRQRDLVIELRAGGLAAFGMATSGPVRTLVTTVLVAAGVHAPGELHLYLLDHGAGELAPLGELPHCGGYVPGADRDRTARVVRALHRELQDRRQRVASDGPLCVGRDVPWLLVVVANAPALLAVFDDLAGFAVRDQLEAVLTGGAALGIVPLVTADRPGALPPAVAAALATRWCFRTGDPFDLAALGLSPGLVPPAIDGRGVRVDGSQAIQIADPGAVARWVATIRACWEATDTQRLPRPIGSMPEHVALTELPPAPAMEDGAPGWQLPIGVDDDLAPAVLPWAIGDHVVVAGSARSGRSTALATLAAAARSVAPGLLVVALLPRAGALPDLVADVVVVETIGELTDALPASQPVLVLVDDAERVDDDGSLRTLLHDRPQLRMAAAGRADALRTGYGHWTAELRRSRTGIVLRPTAEVDGELWQTMLPRHGPARYPAGRGYLVVEGEPRLLQLARP